MLHAARVFFALAGFLCSTVEAQPTVHTADFIPDATRYGFNGFENAPTDSIGSFYDGPFPYVEGGVEVTQFATNPKPIWLKCGAIRASGYCFGPIGHEGKYSWYPNGGDNGYTQITRSGNATFESVGLLAGNSARSTTDTYLSYSLLNDGAVVLSGKLLVPMNSADSIYLGFGGGGFDEVRLSENPISGGSNSLAIDSIELGSLTPVPEPATALLLFAGIFALARTRRSSDA
jgi:PEP-CTERM motif